MTHRNLAYDILIAVVIALSFPLFSSFAHQAMASDLTYQRDYSYQASESDSKLSCRTLALEQVKRLLLEELGSYLSSQTEVKNFQMSRDQITAITAGIVRTEVLKEKWDGTTYYIVAKITTDPGQVAKAVDELRKDKQSLGELEEVKKRTEELIVGLEKLREELKLAKEGEHTQENKDYMAAVKKLGAVDWYKEGFALAEARRYRDAISFYNRSIEADPRNATAYNSRGWAYYKIHDYRSALQDYNRALELKPNFPSALVNRAYTLWGMKQYDKALIDTNRVLELKPEYARAFEARSLIYLYMNENTHAIEDSSKAIELHPNNAYAYLHRGNAYRNTGRYEEALKDYQKSIDINPANPDVFNGRGYALYLLKKYDDALNDINNALEMNKNPATTLFFPAIALYRRGLIYNQFKNSEGAIRDFSKVIEMEKGNAAAYYQRSLGYKQIGKTEESDRDLKKAAQLGYVRAQNALKK
jgi:tetratricopeptide (TPR) repeat protein